jgi:alkanesulfonate monooxygenase SsuD/methylene tetrahydromethanopterin reductase-like flavin-dependent oxidoreductase (luciferase family)
MRVCLVIEGQENVSWEQWLALARACEDHGLDGLFRSDHYLAFRRRDGWGATDAWATIAALAAVTERIRLGTLVSPVAFRHPAALAKMVVTADHVSSGRVELGLGAGWFEREFRTFGFPFPPIADRMDELEHQVETIHRLWVPADDPPAPKEDGGDPLDDRPMLPHAVQRPHPPIIVGGSAGPRGAALAARWADEYDLYFLTPEQIAPKREALDRACEAIGRDPATLGRSILLNVTVAEDEAGLRRLDERLAQAQAGGGDPTVELGGFGPERLMGTPEQVVERLGAYADAGIDRVMLQHLLHEDLEPVRLLGERVAPAVVSFG